MSTHLLLIFLSVFSSGCTINLKQNTNRIVIEEIDKYVNSVNEKELEKKSVFFDGKYKEEDAITVVNVGSSEMTGYYEKDELLKIDVFYNGSHGDLKTIIYCKDGKMIFVQKSLNVFDPPKSEKNSKIKTMILNKYYLSENKIIFFKDEGGAIRYNSPKKIDLEMKLKELNRDFENYIQILTSN